MVAALRQGVVSWIVVTSCYGVPPVWLPPPFRPAPPSRYRPCRASIANREPHDAIACAVGVHWRNPGGRKGAGPLRGGVRRGRSRIGQPYTTHTPSCLASLSKPITAVAIMMLAEQRRLTYDAPLSRFLPGFSKSVGAVTLRHLLTHTSGIPDYPTLDVDRPGVRNAQILAALQQVPNPSFRPERITYSNSGYVLLALIVEAVSGESLPCRARLVKPLGWARPSSLSPDQKAVGVARGYDRDGRVDDFEGMATGESGVYSTVTDLLRFDQALLPQMRLVAERTLAEAFVPARVSEGDTSVPVGVGISSTTPAVCECGTRGTPRASAPSSSAVCGTGSPSSCSRMAATPIAWPSTTVFSGSCGASHRGSRHCRKGSGPSTRFDPRDDGDHPICER